MVRMLTATWDPTVAIAGSEVLDEVTRLKQATAVTSSSGVPANRQTRSLRPDCSTSNRLCTHPVIEGGGNPLFRTASTGTVELLDTKPFATGAVVHAYRPTPAT
jgi:hypothetical protein